MVSHFVIQVEAAKQLGSEAGKMHRGKDAKMQSWYQELVKKNNRKDSLSERLDK